MKVSRIEIKDVNQFEDLDIDLTYPKGHAKEGQPLNKVCFIGQSGTGKTTLLNFIQGLSYYGGALKKKYNMDSLIDHIYITRAYNNTTYKNSIDFNGVIQFDFPDYRQKRQEFDKAIENISVLSMYFPAEKENIDIQSQDTDYDSNGRTYDFRENEMPAIWNMLLTDIKSYQEKELILNQKITNTVFGNKTNLKSEDLEKEFDELQNLRTSNPLIKIANDHLDPILRNFNLKVKTELDIQRKEDIGNIKIIDNRGTEIPYELLSTGTKQILNTALPLYTLKPSQTIILYDEPERSLYPDMQKLIVDYYTSFTKDSQFFFATHSPIIASCFEPWEIVELKFDKEGYVVQEQYYDGERHVDNYPITPKYLDYDQMLQKVFDIDEPYNEERTKKITEFLSLKDKLDFMKNKNEVNTKEYKTTFKNYIKSGKELSWDANTNKVS